MQDIENLCYLIDPSSDWTKKDVSHLSHLKVSINPTRRDILLSAIRSNYWPEAIPESMIVKTPESRTQRAISIISDFIRQPLKGLNFLDYGCGTGDCTYIAKERGATAIGYDIKSDPNWSNLNVHLTSDFKEVQRNGPYDVILLYDLLDHMVSESMNEFMTNLRPLMNTKTVLYVRCHPFSSRHGNHLYETLNKAYAHLFLTPDEVTQLGGIPEIVKGVIHPQLVYPAMFNKLGFTIIKQQPMIVQPEATIEAFLPFLVPTWYQRCNIIDAREILQAISIQFVDFTLR